MTITAYPLVHDVDTEHFAPGGFVSPLTFNVPTHDVAAEHRPAMDGSGPGASLLLDDDLAIRPAPPTLGRYFIEVRDLNGGIAGYSLLDSNPGVDHFTIEKMSWQLNGQGGATMHGPILDDVLLSGLIDVNGNAIDGHEVHFGRDDLGVCQITVPSPRANPQQFQAEAFGVPFHLTHRYIGRNNPTPNLVVNGGFDTDILDWTGNAVSSMVWSPDPVDTVPGSLVLTASSAGDSYAYQNIEIDALPYATFVWLEAAVWVDDAVDPVNLATSGRGLWTVWTEGSTVVWQQGVSPNWRNTDVWQKVHTKIFVDAGFSGTVQVRLYCPRGLVRWDTVIMHREERLACSGTPSDIIGCLVAHAQDGGFNKGELNISVDNSRGEGAITINRFYKFAEAAQILQAMGEMASLAGGVDWLCEYPAANARTIFTMERSGWEPPTKLTLTWGENLNGWTWVWNPARHTEILRVQGRGSGDQVTEAIALVPDEDRTWAWEFVRRASIEGSDHPVEQALGLFNLYRRPLTVQATVRRTEDFDVLTQLCTSNGGDGPLLPGRRVHVDIEHGPISVHEDFKVLQVDFTPEHETADVQLVAVSTLEDE